jgi:hypothetical protein
MSFWEIFWLVNIIFALISFTILSLKVLVKGFKEVKDMLTALEDNHNSE